VCYCDATIALPILTHGLLEAREAAGAGPREGMDLGWLFDESAEKA
jgi:hypothetical protein